MYYFELYYYFVFLLGFECAKHILTFTRANSQKMHEKSLNLYLIFVKVVK